MKEQFIGSLNRHPVFWTAIAAFIILSPFIYKSLSTEMIRFCSTDESKIEEKLRENSGWEVSSSAEDDPNVSCLRKRVDKW